MASPRKAQVNFEDDFSITAEASRPILFVRNVIFLWSVRDPDKLSEKGLPVIRTKIMRFLLV